MAVANEKKLADWMSRLCYAHFDDIRAKWTEQEPYSHNIYQHYTNLDRKKEEQKEVKNIFAINDQAKQHLRFLLDKMVTEVSAISISDDDTIDVIREKLVSEHATCFTKFIIDTNKTNVNRFAKTLRDAADVTMWVHSHMVGSMPVYSTKPIIVAKLSSEFNNFLKVIAWHIGYDIWYEQCGFDGDILSATLARLGFDQPCIDEMRSSIRAKKPAKPRAKKDAPADNATPASSAAPANSAAVTDLIGSV